MIAFEARRAGRCKRRCLASASWLLVLAGVSCTWPVQLPGAVDDAGMDASGTGEVEGPDASVDQFSSSDRRHFNGSDECPNPHFISLVPNSVEMIVALDRSTSMQQHAFDPTTTRWQAAQQAILAEIQNHPSIQFGLELFPWSSDCSNGATCCAGQVSVSPAPNQSTSIATQMACGSGDAGCPIAGDDSPSPLALGHCRESFGREGFQPHLFQFVLLMTDQDPTCAGDFSDGSPCSVAVNEASKLGAENVGVQTFVVALNGDAQSTDCLPKIAAANAASFNGGSQFFAATDPTGLGQQLDAIMSLAEANLCRFSLWRAPNNPDQLDVTINGKSVAPDSSGQQGGWSLSDSSTLVFSGSSCSDLMAGHTPAVRDCSY